MTLPAKDNQGFARNLRRRDVLRVLAGLGVGTISFQRALAVRAAEEGRITAEMIQQAEWIAGLSLSDEEREVTARAVENVTEKFAQLREVEVGYDVPPAVQFNAAPGTREATQPKRTLRSGHEDVQVERPSSDAELAFLSLTELANLIRTRKVSSIELTKLYLERLRRYDKALLCVANYTEDLALEQAAKADREIQSGKYRGPLHGIPWGAKDLIAVPGYSTGWGATPFKDQVLESKATVARRLEEAGAVLIAKLSLGALAMGDEWYGGKTRNPWNPKQGSSGSSAGSAAATAAGLVGFALGSETLGSIVSPSRRCGVTGLRPTFGRVSRHGCMSLAWSMDKIGPMARSVRDCAVILAAIHGFDGLDSTAVDQAFVWPRREGIDGLTVGYFEGESPRDEREELRVLADLGVRLVPIKLPKKYPVWPLTAILNTEAAAVFDPLTRAGIGDGLGRWPNLFRQGQFVPAVEYLRANRIRTLVMREMDELMKSVDCYVGGSDLALTNLTGHPTIVLPNGIHKKGDTVAPKSIAFTGRLFGESALLAVAAAYQEETGFHHEHPDMTALEDAEDA